MPSLIGQSIGRYHILEQLGEGGMATVYKAFDTRLERDVAIKVIRRNAFPVEQHELVLKRFEREAKALAKLNHPNIVGVIDYGEYEDAPYLVMPYFPGGTLKERLGKPIPWREAVRQLLPIAHALHYAHEQGIIHRDVKPSNVLITRSGEPMLSDFGIAKILEGGGTTALTGTGVGVGTPEYMAPEQWTGQACVQSDIYSLGVIFYELVTGRKPYVADTPAAILLKQATEPLPRPRQYAPELPDDVERILLKVLAHEPENRYQAMGDFAAAIESLSLEQTVQAMASNQVTLPKVQPVVEAQEIVVEEKTRAARYEEPAPRKVEPAPAPTPMIQPKQPPIPKPPRKRGRWIGWAIGIGAVILLLGIGGTIAILSAAKPAKTPAVTERPAATRVPPTQVPSSGPQTNTYTNEEKGVSIQYPGEWSNQAPDSTSPALTTFASPDMSVQSSLLVQTAFNGDTPESVARRLNPEALDGLSNVVTISDAPFQFADGTQGWRVVSTATMSSGQNLKISVTIGIHGSRAYMLASFGLIDAYDNHASEINALAAGMRLSATESDCPRPDVFCVGLVTDVGTINDKSFNQSAWEGVVQSKDSGTADWIRHIETKDTADYEKNIATFADAGYDVIVTVGFNMTEVTYAMALKFPNVKFIAIDQTLSKNDRHPDWPLPNLVDLYYKEDHSSFLVGALATMMSSTHKIGAVCGPDSVPPVWRYGEGYRSGAAYADGRFGTQTEVFVIYHNNVDFSMAFVDPDWGAEMAKGLIADGVDVIFGCGAETGNGAVRAAADNGVYAIGVDTDQYYTLPEARTWILSSALKPIREPVAFAIQLAKEGKFPQGGFMMSPPGFAPYHDLAGKVPEWVDAEMQAIFIGLTEGKIGTGVPEAKP